MVFMRSRLRRIEPLCAVRNKAREAGLAGTFPNRRETWNTPIPSRASKNTEKRAKSPGLSMRFVRMELDISPDSVCLEAYF
jgi:hypothetical protein